MNRRWVSVHAYYHGDLDTLLLGGVAPLLAELRAGGLVERSFFLRYWDGGPHLRLRLLPPSDSDSDLVTAGTADTADTADSAEVERLALDRLRRYLASHPAPESTAVAGYPRLAPRLAGREGVTDYLRQPLPNNTVHAIAYAPETDRYGEGPALAAVEDHFAESSRIALGLIAAGATMGHRHTTALCAIMLGWLAAGRAPAPVTDPELEERYLASRAALHTLTVRVAEIANGTSTLPASGALTAWWRSIGAEPVRRVADLCAHLLCNRLGLSYPDERTVRKLAARAVADHPVGAR